MYLKYQQILSGSPVTFLPVGPAMNMAMKAVADPKLAQTEITGPLEKR
jgi:hypothetical protein